MALRTTGGGRGGRAGGGDADAPLRGRGATLNLEGRFERVQRETEDDGWARDDEPPPPVPTQVLPDVAKSIISRNDSPDVGFDQSINPYRGCEHGCVYCLDGDTAVLLPDGSTRALVNLRVGDAIVGTRKVGGERRYVVTRVLAHWRTRKRAWRVTLAGGTQLVASADHRFLTERGWRYVSRGAGDAPRPVLGSADVLIGCHGPAAGNDPGESLRGGARPTGALALSVAAQLDLELLERDDAGESSSSIAIGQLVQSPDGLRVVSIEALAEERDLYDITTGTEDFIANGVVSHNCYARPAHGYVGLSPGIDFETRIFAKHNAAELLERELAAPGYRCRNIQIGGNTDPYQQAERELKITRSVIEVLARHEHPFSIITKNALIERDIDLMAPMAAKGLVRAYVSVTNWETDLARKLEPRASAPWRRIEAIRRLSAAGIPTGVMVAPIIPFITDRFMEEILERAKDAGAIGAGYVLLRLPHEIEPLWEAWLAAHYPLKAKHVMSLVRQTRGGKAYDARWGVRQRGTGAFADLIEKRFALACERLDLNGPRPALDTAQFRKPAAAKPSLRKPADDGQLDLF